MPDHYLTETPSKFVSSVRGSLKHTLRLYEAPLTLTIFVVTVSKELLVLKYSPESRTYLPSITSSPDGRDYPYHSCLLTSIALKALEDPLTGNAFADSLQILDFAFDSPIIYTNEKVELAVVATVSRIPAGVLKDFHGSDTRFLVPLDRLASRDDWAALDLNAVFADQVKQRIHTYSRQFPSLDTEQRKTLLLNHISTMLATKRLAGERKANHDVLVLRCPQEEGGPRLWLMQMHRDKVDENSRNDVYGYLHEEKWADWVGYIAMREDEGFGRISMAALADDWPVESVFANEGRLLASWIDHTSNQIKIQEGKRLAMYKVELVDWLA